MTQPKISILIPNYRTPDLTRLCLRLLRKYTNFELAKVLVVDNDSRDESLEYLKTIPWIQLVERPKIPGESVNLNHARGLDLLMEQVDTPYVLSIHTDTIIKRPDWIEFLINEIEKDPNIGGVGSWKLEMKPWYRRLSKKIEYYIQSAYYSLIGKTDHCLAGKGDNFLYIRSHCALFRTDLMRQYQVQFQDGDGNSCKAIHKVLSDNGHKIIFLDSQVLGKYMEHWNHATMILNPELGRGKKNKKRGLVKLEKALNSVQARSIIQDASMDA